MHVCVWGGGVCRGGGGRVLGVDVGVGVWLWVCEQL